MGPSPRWAAVLALLLLPTLPVAAGSPQDDLCIRVNEPPQLPDVNEDIFAACGSTEHVSWKGYVLTVCPPRADCHGVLMPIERPRALDDVPMA